MSPLLLRHSGNFIKSLLVFTLCALSACGGGQATSSGGTSASSPPASTALRDNPSPTPQVITSHVTRSVTIDPNAYQFVDSRLFLKLSLDSGEVVFLGEINRLSPSTLPIEVPQSLDVIKFELFTTSPSDQIVFGELSL